MRSCTSAGLASRPAVISELELNGYAIERVYDHTPPLAKTRRSCQGPGCHGAVSHQRSAFALRERDLPFTPCAPPRLAVAPFPAFHRSLAARPSHPSLPFVVDC